MRSRFLAALVVLLALGVAWLVMTTRDRGAPTSESPFVVEAPAPTENDAAASVQVPPAASGERSALATSHSEAREVELDRELSIQVVDGAGKPVSGVPVGIRHCPGDGVPDDAWTGVTEGEQGIARVPHVERYLARLKTNRACAHLAILAHDLERAAFDLDSLPAQPIVLHLPPTGSVELALLDDARRPVSAKFILLTEGTQVGADGFPVKVDGPQLEPVAVEEGRAFYPHVGLGLDLIAFASAPGYPPKGVHAIGPRIPGERVTIDLDLGMGTFIVARLVDVSGIALANRAVRVEMQQRTSHGFGGSNSQDTQSDASGRIRMPLYTKVTRDVRGTVAIRVDSSGGVEEASAVAAFPADMHEGDNDLGDLRLEPPSIVLSGVVVDELGRPVHALIGVQMKGDARSLSDWQAAAGLSAACDADGKFVVTGPMPACSLRLSARMVGYAQGDFVEAKPGARDVKILLPRRCKLAGSVLMDASSSRGRLRVGVKRDGDPKAHRSDVDVNESAFVRNDGGFELDSLRAGLVAVEIRSETSPMVALAVIEHVELRPGEETRDARLQNIDLRHVRFVQLEIVDQDDQAVPFGQVTSTEPDQSSSSRYTITNGSVLVVARSLSLELDVRSPGFRPVHLRDVWEDARVRLMRGPGVRIRLAENTGDVGPVLELGVAARKLGSRVERSGRWLDGGASWIERRQASIRVSEPGTYELFWMIRKASGPKTGWRDLANAHPQRIEVIDSDTEQEFTAAPDPIELADALHAFAR